MWTMLEVGWWYNNVLNVGGWAGRTASENEELIFASAAIPSVYRFEGAVLLQDCVTSLLKTSLPVLVSICAALFSCESVW